MNEEQIKKRKVYEINELLQSNDKKLKELYLAIKNASDYAAVLNPKLAKKSAS